MKRDVSSVSPVGGGGGGRAMALSSMAALHYVCVSMFQWGTVESIGLLVNMCVWKIRSVFAGTTNGDFFRPNVLSFFFSFFSFLLYFFPGWRRDVRTFTSQDSRSTKNLDVSTLLRSHKKQKQKLGFEKKSESALFLFAFGFFSDFTSLLQVYVFFTSASKWMIVNSAVPVCFFVRLYLHFDFFKILFFYLFGGEGGLRGRAAKKEKKKSPTFLTLSVCF